MGTCDLDDSEIVDADEGGIDDDDDALKKPCKKAATVKVETTALPLGPIACHAVSNQLDTLAPIHKSGASHNAPNNLLQFSLRSLDSSLSTARDDERAMRSLQTTQLLALSNQLMMPKEQPMTSGASCSRLTIQVMMQSNVLIMQNWSYKWKECGWHRACPCEALNTMATGTGITVMVMNTMSVAVLLTIEVAASPLLLSHHPIGRKRHCISHGWIMTYSAASIQHPTTHTPQLIVVAPLIPSSNLSALTT